MNFFFAAVLGVVEGLTEFLPISSTFHLILVSNLLKIPQTDFLKLFEVVIQPAAILAIVLLNIKTLWSDSKLQRTLILSFIPTMIVGLVLYKIIKLFFFSNNLLQIIVFLIVGVLFIVFEKFYNKKLHRKYNSLSVKEAIVVGLVQSLAVIPGVSRSGAVMLGMMYLGFERKESAKYSFLLAVPTIFAASLFDLFQNKNLLINNIHNFQFLIVGFIVTFIVTIFIVKWFLDFLQKNTLVIFGYYRIVVGIILLFMLIFNLR